MRLLSSWSPGTLRRHTFNVNQRLCTGTLRYLSNSQFCGAGYDPDSLAVHNTHTKQGSYAAYSYDGVLKRTERGWLLAVQAHLMFHTKVRQL